MLEYCSHEQYNYSKLPLRRWPFSLVGAGNLIRFGSLIAAAPQLSIVHHARGPPFLCTATWLAHTRTLIEAETASNQARLELTRLGRQLRRLVGRNEGLHACALQRRTPARRLSDSGRSQEKVSVC